MSKKKEGKKKEQSRLSAIIKTLLKYNVVLGINPPKLRMILEDLGPTYVKIGQILSMRPDLINIKYCKELEQLRSNVKPMEIDVVKQIIKTELGKGVEEIFESFDEKPLGSASIAQAHSAVLKTGEKVVIKVQRPNIYNQMKGDIDLLKKACSMLKIDKMFKDKFDIMGIIDEMWKTTQEELDFTIEADNIDEMIFNNKNIKYVKFPKVYKELSTSHVMTMEKICGVKIDDTEKLKELGYDLDDLGKKLCENYVKQIFDDAFFHADPHPGNIFVEDGKIAWIDLGMVGKLDEHTQSVINACIRYLIIGDNDLLFAEILKLCPPPKDADLDMLKQDIEFLVNKYMNMNIKYMDMGEIINELLSCISANKLKIPSNLTMFARGILTIEDVIAKLSPNVNVLEIAKSHIGTSVFSLDFKQEAVKMGRDVYKSIKKSLAIPAQVGQILDMQIKGKNKIVHEYSANEKYIKMQNKKLYQIALMIFAGLFLVIPSVFMLFISTMDYLLPFIIVGYSLSLIMWILFIFSLFHSKKK